MPIDCETLYPWIFQLCKISAWFIYKTSQEQKIRPSSAEILPSSAEILHSWKIQHVGSLHVVPGSPKRDVPFGVMPSTSMLVPGSEPEGLKHVLH